MADLVGAGAEDWGLTLGFGSVGKRHARTLSSLFEGRLVIVETQEASRRAAIEEHPAARIAASLEELDAASPDWPRAVAVIATWGPSHAPLFHGLADRGVRRVLCEKPMAASVADAASMAGRARRDGITLSIHHFIRYAGLAPALARETERHGLGRPVALVVTGGAACLVTNGIHWLDFASEIFESAPLRVVSTAQAQPINPRSPDLAIFGGSACFDFGEGRELLFALNAGSSVALSARIYYRDAVADLDADLGVRLRRRDEESVRRFPAVTRTGPAERELFEGALPGVLEYLEGMRHAAEDVRAAGMVRCPPESGVESVSACVGMLAAGRECRTVDLPVDPAGPLGREAWPIS